MNAFLTLAATRHTLSPEVIKTNERLHRIVEAAKAGRVPVRLVCSGSCASLNRPLCGFVELILTFLVRFLG